MRALSLAINGRKVRAEVEPRLSLVDFLREHQFLTATHIGCEHGVCGACTVLIDGAPARSCITYAVAVDGAAVTTLEGLEGDPVTSALQEAFSAHHALQCGFCTPGMLMTARYIVTRLPSADERRIRLELSGNLCRCTGYMGIVEAVQSTLAKAGSLPGTPTRQRDALGPVGSHRPTTSSDNATLRPGAKSAGSGPAVAAAPDSFGSVDWAAVERDGVQLRQSFTVPFERAAVWQFFSDVERVAKCMPGARMTAPVRAGRGEGEVSVKLGPIVSVFQGVVDIERDDAAYRGIVRGVGRDARSPSSARALIVYEVQPAGAQSARVDVSVTFLLSGPLAQFSRSGLVRDVAGHLTQVFARNLEASLSGAPAETKSGEVLDAAAVARSALWARITASLRRLLGR